MIFTWSEWKELGQRCIYVWTELRKACPLDLSLSNSVGNAGGGGDGWDECWYISLFQYYFSGCLNPIISSFNCLLVSSSLSCESARACSKATRRSCTESGNACCIGFMVRKD